MPLNFTKSINLAVSERGIHALRLANHPTLLESVMDSTIPMRGRMIHGRGPAGALYELSQDYDSRGRVSAGFCRILPCRHSLIRHQSIHAIDRSVLNARLLGVLESMPNVKLFFNHKLTGANFNACRAWFEALDQTASPNGRCKEIEVGFDIMIGADGAHSAVRHHMMKFSRMDYQQEYIDTLWCEFRLGPREADSVDGPRSRYQISPNHLHIWPGRDFMFIAIPSEVRSRQQLLIAGTTRLLITILAGWFVHLHLVPSEQAICRSRARFAHPSSLL